MTTQTVQNTLTLISGIVTPIVKTFKRVFLILFGAVIFYISFLCVSTPLPPEQTTNVGLGFWLGGVTLITFFGGIISIIMGIVNIYEDKRNWY